MSEISTDQDGHILHFSDGIMIDPKDEECCGDNLNTTLVGSQNRILKCIDWLGEKLAWGLGISSPKYYYIIQDSKHKSFDPQSISLGDLDDPHVAIISNAKYDSDACNSYSTKCNNAQ